MLDYIAFTCLVGAFLILVALSVVDLKTRLLPNEMVLGFVTLGLVFHLTTLGHFSTPLEIALGGTIGFLSLYLIRIIANKLYDTDALGLGDVKLMGAGGLWLGPDLIMIAMSVGATASLLHGLGVALHTAKKTNTKPELAYLQIPAGPGFAIGIIIAAIIKFWEFRPF